MFPVKVSLLMTAVCDAKLILLFLGKETGNLQPCDAVHTVMCTTCMYYTFKWAPFAVVSR